MGIPSYYKKLISSIPNLLSKGHPNADINWLFMDFNCLIYHTLHRHDTPPYPGVTMKEEWESKFIQCVIEYCLKIIKQVDPKSGVFIAIDGVVPMAKMRQQRLRRFKSIWQSSNDNSGVEQWDKNSITPGTLFMKKLKNRMEEMIARHGKKSWFLSSSDEPGEGEHKIINQWRTGNYTGNFAVYGLDADLIVLSILGYETCSLDNNIWLFREEVVEGKIAYDKDGEEICEWFSINSLRDWISSDYNTDRNIQKKFLLNYCCAMSILGNDFLPSSLGLKMRDDGHTELLEIVKNLTSNNIKLVSPTDLTVTSDIIELFRILASGEPARIAKYIHKKKMLGRSIEGDLPIGDNNYPLNNIEEDILLGNNKTLINNWEELYITHFFNGYTYNKRNIDKICKEYLFGIQWIWAYYTGQYEKVCFNWYYPHSLPPTWRWLDQYLKNTMLPTFPDTVLVRAEDIRPVEQLALVLPLESWYLIPPCRERKLPQLAPQFYPESFSFDSLGKRYFWECESLIPIPSIYQIKKIIAGSEEIT
jgi:5'-3' exonuclease